MPLVEFSCSRCDIFHVVFGFPVFVIVLRDGCPETSTFPAGGVSDIFVREAVDIESNNTRNRWV